MNTILATLTAMLEEAQERITASLETLRHMEKQDHKQLANKARKQCRKAQRMAEEAVILVT
jgi:CelD/BcsL family acetyltransferase involved in cellulose biosynthesis